MTSRVESDVRGNPNECVGMWIPIANSPTEVPES